MRHVTGPWIGKQRNVTPTTRPTSLGSRGNGPFPAEHASGGEVEPPATRSSKDLGAAGLGAAPQPDGPRNVVVRDNRVLGGPDFLSGQDRIRHPDVGGGTPIGRTRGRSRNSRSPDRHWTACRVRKNPAPRIHSRHPPPWSARPGFPAPCGFPRRSPSPGPVAGLSAIRQGCAAVHRTTRPQPYARGEAPQPHRAPGKAHPRGLHGDLPDARAHGIARQPGRDRMGSRAGTAGHHRFAARQLLRHRRRLETPRPPSGPAPGHHSSRSRGHRRTRTRTRTRPRTPPDGSRRREDRRGSPHRKHGRKNRNHGRKNRRKCKRGCPGTEVPGQPLPLSLRPSAAVTRPCSGSARLRRPPARSAGRPAAPTSPHPGR